MTRKIRKDKCKSFESDFQVGSRGVVTLNVFIFVFLAPLLCCGKWQNAATEKSQSLKTKNDIRFCSLNSFIGLGIIRVFIFFRGGGGTALKIINYFLFIDYWKVENRGSITFISVP